MVDFDESKDALNQQQHGISLACAADFDFGSALELEDTRRDYGEKRMIAIGYIGHRLHVLIYTRRNRRLRAISLRKANDRERKLYETAI